MFILGDGEEKKNEGWGNPRIGWQKLRAKKQVV
jgi:hypothetical protein